MLSLTQSLGDLGMADGVRVNAVNPGNFATDRLSNRIRELSEMQGVSRQHVVQQLLAESATKRFGRPPEIGDLVAYLASPRAACMQGAIVDIDGSWNRAV